MKIGEVSRRSGLSIDTLRFYEKRGLIDPPWREGGRRDYDEAILTWVDFLKALKATGMPLADVETYARLRRNGEATSAHRRQMLEQQRERVAQKIAELADCLRLLDFKIANYRDIEARHTALDSMTKGTRTNGR
jgi:DNA-binding transcriptional MerR regulator